jgi:hypothetical protein
VIVFIRERYNSLEEKANRINVDEVFGRHRCSQLVDIFMFSLDLRA